MKKKYFLPVISFFIFFNACGIEAENTVSEQKAIEKQIILSTEIDPYIEALKKKGFTVKTEEKIKPYYFSVQAETVRANGEKILFFEYQDQDAMEKDASYVSPDGSAVENKSEPVDWVSDPHFYKKGKLIALYVGDNINLIRALEDLMGKQFAGK